MRALRAVPLLLALLLPGCSGSPWGDTLGAVFDTTPAEPEEAPAEASLALNLGHRATIARLVQQLGERRLWRTRDGVVLATDGPRIVATSGLSDVLAATRFDGPDPLADPRALVSHVTDARRLIDLMRADRQPENMRFGVFVDCRLHAAAAENDDTTLVIEERCRAPGIGRFTNTFWADAQTGTIERSEQWVGPGLPHLAVEHVSPPG